jgi:hypothetical protein
MFLIIDYAWILEENSLLNGCTKFIKCLLIIYGL